MAISVVHAVPRFPFLAIFQPHSKLSPAALCAVAYCHTSAVYLLILSSRVAFDEPDGSVGENLFLKLIFIAKFLFRERQCEAFKGHLWPFSASSSICACAMI
jgi:hypothetical protein